MLVQHWSLYLFSIGPCACSALVLVLVQHWSLYLFSIGPCTCSALVLVLVQHWSLYLFSIGPCACSTLVLVLVQHWSLYLFSIGPCACSALVLLFVQELLAVSVISFRRVMAQLYGYISTFRGVPHNYGGALSAGLMVCWDSSDMWAICWPSISRLLCYMFTRIVSSVNHCYSRSSAPYYILCHISQPAHYTWSELNRKAI